MAAKKPVELDHKTFDLIEALRGTAFPEHTFPVWFDSKAAYDVDRLAREFEVAGEDDRSRLEGELREARQRLGESRYEITVRGFPTHIAEAITQSVMKKYNIRPGQPLSSAALDAYTNKLWATYIVQVESPTGEILSPVSQAEVEALLELAPADAINRIRSGIGTLEGGVSRGFELAASSTDFLSDASLEA